jgi:hypothetical protein
MKQNLEENVKCFGLIRKRMIIFCGSVLSNPLARKRVSNATTEMYNLFPVEGKALRIAGRRAVCNETRTKNETSPVCNGRPVAPNYFFPTGERSALTRVMHDSHSFVCLVVALLVSQSPRLPPHLSQSSYITLSPQVLRSRYLHDKFLGFASG